MFINANSFKQIMAIFFSTLFYLFSIALALLTVQEFLHGFNGETSMIGAFIKAINTAVIALATFELGTVVSKEYRNQEEGNIVIVLRRTVPRFVSITCIALVLEGLLLVIKYSQLELAGNLYYPVAIIAAASLLLIALGIFLRFSYPPALAITAEQQAADGRSFDPRQSMHTFTSQQHSHMTV